MLKVFQLRAARSVCGIGVRDIGLYLKVSGTIVSRWEQQAGLDEIKSNVTNPDALIFFFEQYRILFPDAYTVNFRHKDTSEISEYLTRFQLRAARAALSITQLKLSELTNIPVANINYLESQDNEMFLNKTRKLIDNSIFRSFFEQHGIIFPNNFAISVLQNSYIV